MTTYTTEDFANAEFARHASGSVAARFYDRGSMPWLTADGISLSNYDMADYGWVPVREAWPITLEGLRDAWETAEWAEKCNEGDILIYRDPTDPTECVEIWASEEPEWISANARILRRASEQEREPWQDLADVLGTDGGELIAEHHTITEVAKALHERGVRVTEEGEK